MFPHIRRGKFPIENIFSLALGQTDYSVCELLMCSYWQWGRGRHDHCTCIWTARALTWVHVKLGEVGLRRNNVQMNNLSKPSADFLAHNAQSQFARVHGAYGHPVQVTSVGKPKLRWMWSVQAKTSSGWCGMHEISFRPDSALKFPNEVMRNQKVYWLVSRA
jgi:hypothetical protein